MPRLFTSLLNLYIYKGIKELYRQRVNTIPSTPPPPSSFLSLSLCLLVQLRLQQQHSHTTLTCTNAMQQQRSMDARVHQLTLLYETPRGKTPASTALDVLLNLLHWPCIALLRFTQHYLCPAVKMMVKPQKKEEVEKKWYSC